MALRSRANPEPYSLERTVLATSSNTTGYAMAANGLSQGAVARSCKCRKSSAIFLLSAPPSAPLATGRCPTSDRGCEMSFRRLGALNTQILKEPVAVYLSIYCHREIKHFHCGRLYVSNQSYVSMTRTKRVSRLWRSSGKA